MIMVVDIGLLILCMTKGRFLHRPRIECPGHEPPLPDRRSSRSTFEFRGAARLHCAASPGTMGWAWRALLYSAAVSPHDKKAANHRLTAFHRPCDGTVSRNTPPQPNRAAPIAGRTAPRIPGTPTNCLIRRPSIGAAIMRVTKAIEYAMATNLGKSCVAETSVTT